MEMVGVSYEDDKYKNRYSYYCVDNNVIRFLHLPCLRL